MTPDHTPSSPTVGAETAEQHLARFYVELLAWSDGGRQSPSKFSPSIGLCGNLEGWLDHEGIDDDLYWSILDALTCSFDVAELHDVYPFNSRGEAEYGSERRADGLYKNPARLAWIKAHASSALSNGEHSRGGV